jgi:hypothetical protein
VVAFYKWGLPNQGTFRHEAFKFQQLKSLKGVVHDHQQANSIQAENAIRLLGRLCETRPQPHGFYSTTDAHSNRPTLDTHGICHLCQKIFIWFPPLSVLLSFISLASQAAISYSQILQLPTASQSTLTLPTILSTSQPY